MPRLPRLLRVPGALLLAGAGVYGALSLLGTFGPDRLRALDGTATGLGAWLQTLAPGFLILRGCLYGLIVWLLPQRAGGGEASARLRRRLIVLCAAYEALFGLDLPALLFGALR